MPIRYKQYRAWENAHELVLSVYRATADFPTEERFGITSQLRRAAASICANIAEGCERKTTKEFIQFLYISRGSLSETHYFILLAKDLGYLTEDIYHVLDKKADDLGAMLHGLINSLQRRLSPN